MKRLAKILVITLSVVVAGAALLLIPQKIAVGGASALAAPSPSPIVCRPVHGSIHSVFTTQNCTSPVGLCTAGTISDGSCGAEPYRARAVLRCEHAVDRAVHRPARDWRRRTGSVFLQHQQQRGNHNYDTERYSKGLCESLHVFLLLSYL